MGINKTKSPTCFCHNDLQELNIMVHNDNLTFIDWEYSSYGHRDFDIANFMSEAMYNYQVTNKEGYKLTVENYPTIETQKTFLKSYFNFENELTIDQEKEISEIICSVNKFSLVADILWTVWSLIQNPIEGFDYIDYAKCRLENFYNRRDEI